MSNIRPWLLIIVLGLAGTCSWPARAQDLTASTLSTQQRDWLLEQVRLGQASGRADLVENSLARLELMQSDDREALLAGFEAQLTLGQTEAAADTLGRLEDIAPESTEWQRANQIWRAWQGDLREQVQQARLLATGGRDQEALAIFQSLFHDEPPGLRLGVDYWQLYGQSSATRPRAIGKLEALDRSYPGNSALLLALAGLLLDAGRDAEALAVLRRVSGSQQDLQLAAAREWAFLSAQPATAENVRRLENFLLHYPGADQSAAAQDLYRQQKTLVEDPAWQAGLTGLRLVAEDDYAAATVQLRRALERYPEEPDFLGNLGTALAHTGHREAALDYYQRAQAHLPEGSYSEKWTDLARSTHLWVNLEQADAALEAGQLQRAERLYAEVRRQDPDIGAAWVGLAEVAQRRNDPAAALDYLRGARSRDPDNGNITRHLAALYQEFYPQQFPAFVRSLPAAEREPYAAALRQQRQDAQLARYQRLREEGNTAAAIPLGRQLRRQLPADPWLAYRLASDLRAEGRNRDAAAVMADMSRHAPTDPQARYAQALDLASGDQDQAALDALARVPEERWDEDMRALAERLQRRLRLASARQLRAAKQEPKAVALLEQGLPDAELALILADWAGQRGDQAAAQRYYEQVLRAQPDNRQAQMGRMQAWLALGRRQEVRAWLLDQWPASPEPAEPYQKEVADLWLALGERERAVTTLTDYLDHKHEADPVAWRDLARWSAADRPQQALSAYAHAMHEAGLVDGERLPDARGLTRASRAVAGDDWLARSIRSDVEDFYQRHNPTLTLMQQSARRRDGTPGLSRMRRDSRGLQLTAPLGGGLGWARAEQVHIDSGRFQAPGGRYTEDFGSCNLPLIEADGSRGQADGCSTQYRQRLSSGAGLAVGWSSPDERYQFDLGHTPAGYPVSNWLGGFTYNGDLRQLYWSVTASRRPMDNSLLSQAGRRDPRTGLRWGGVTANGVTLSLGYDQGGANGVWSNWGWHRLRGKNVRSNMRWRAMGGWYHRLLDRPDLALDAGVNAMLWHYQYDLGDYNWGQGGYYSPQRYLSLSLPVGLAWRNGNWSLLGKASVSWSRSRSNGGSRLPDAAANRRLLRALAGTHPGASLDQSQLQRDRSHGSSTGYYLHAALERRLGDHWVLGAAGTVQRSRDFSPNTVELYLRYSFKPWQGNLPLPLTPPETYAEFR